MRRTALLAALPAVLVAGLLAATAAAPPAATAQIAPAHHRPDHTKGPKPTTTATSSTSTSTTTAPPTSSTTPTSTTTPPPAAGTCTAPVWTTTGNDDMQNFNGYWVHNNVWNPAAGASQKLSVCSERSWFVEASNFPDNGFEVFSYPNVHKDLPNWPNGVPVSSLGTVTSRFAGVPQDKGNFNVAYDVWINGVGWGGGSTELMIWTETRPQTLQPLGADLGDYTINGVVYDVYHYNDGNANVVSYKARSTVRSGTFDLKQIIGDGVARGFIPANPNLSAVDYGIEYRYTAGTARFDVTDFSVTTS